MEHQVRVVDGKVELPNAVVRDLGGDEGAKFSVEVRNGQAIVVRDRHEALAEALAELQPWGVSAVDDLIAERRAEGYLTREEFREWLIERYRDA